MLGLSQTQYQYVEEEDSKRPADQRRAMFVKMRRRAAAREFNRTRGLLMEEDPDVQIVVATIYRGAVVYRCPTCNKTNNRNIDVLDGDVWCSHCHVPALVTLND